MKTIINFAFAMLFSVTLMAAPANLFSAKPTTTKTNSVNQEVTVKSNSSESMSIQSHPDYKILERGKKKLEYQYHLYA